MSDTPPSPTLTETMDGLRQDGGVWKAHVAPGWSQGRAGFGGIVTALALAAVRRETGIAHPLRSFTMAFVGPANGEVTIAVTPLRAGRSASFMQAMLVGPDGGVAGSFTACFGPDRESRLSRPAPADTALPDREGAMVLPFVEGVVPVFLRHFDVRVATGLPFMGRQEPEVRWWVRHRDPAARGTELGLVSLLDVLPPAATPMIQGPVPVASLTWFVDFPDGVDAGDLKAPAPDGWYLQRSAADHVGHGFSGQAMTTHAADGRLIAIHRQSVGIFG